MVENSDSPLYTSLCVTMTGPDSAVRMYAALMGVMAPEIQQSVALIRYEKGGSDREHRITFESLQAAEGFVTDADALGIRGWSYDPETNQVTLMDVKDWNGIDLEPVIRRYGRQITDIEQRSATVEVIRDRDYGRVMRESRNTLPRDDAGTSGKDLDNLLRTAEERLARELSD